MRISPIVYVAADAFDHDPNQLVTKLRQGHEAYTWECVSRLERLEDRTVLTFPTRRTPDAKIYRSLDGHIDNPDDIEVFLGAHDVAGNVDGTILWTKDFSQIVTNRQVILAETSLDNVIFLGAISPSPAA
ncbi:hypothetical protein [Methanocalculus sp.]|uniref:hypothetical protein n=1 Tax=Methanocalculus sp. TaxID=2004547 RepID=UPI00262A0015|nr:hypothetical protein [Methanocalculus sp.]MDG6250336.1 hypothetical protein [Methanocalculus sp.]